MCKSILERRKLRLKQIERRLMMREIKFRGLRTDGEGWVYGDLMCNWTVPQILSEEDGNEYLVIPESVGEFTGLHDKNGKEIYEGDAFQADEPGEYYLIEWNDEDAKFQVNLYGYNMYLNEGGGEEHDNETSCVDTDCFELSALTEDEITGNIHGGKEINNERN